MINVLIQCPTLILVASDLASQLLHVTRVVNTQFVNIALQCHLVIDASLDCLPGNGQEVREVLRLQPPTSNNYLPTTDLFSNDLAEIQNYIVYDLDPVT